MPEFVYQGFLSFIVLNSPNHADYLVDYTYMFKKGRDTRVGTQGRDKCNYFVQMYHISICKCVGRRRSYTDINIYGREERFSINYGGI